MGDVITYALHLTHEALDVIQHPIDEQAQPVEIAGAAIHGQPAGEIAGDDALDRPRDGVDPPHRAEPGDHGAGEADHEQKHPAPGHRIAQQFPQLIRLVDALTQHEQIIRRHTQRIRAIRTQLAAGPLPILERPPERRREPWQRRQVAGDITAVRVKSPKGWTFCGSSSACLLRRAAISPGLAR